jgi:hypothetical protein
LSERESSQAEIAQIEAEAYAPTDIPVRIEGPADVRLLPAVAWNITRYELSDTVGPVKASSRNQLRKRLLLIAETAGILFGDSDAKVRGRSTAGFLPLTVLLELTHTEEVWVNNVAAESPKVTVIEEMWTN